MTIYANFLGKKSCNFESPTSGFVYFTSKKSSCSGTAKRNDFENRLDQQQQQQQTSPPLPSPKKILMLLPLCNIKSRTAGYVNTIRNGITQAFFLTREAKETGDVCVCQFPDGLCARPREKENGLLRFLLNE